MTSEPELPDPFRVLVLAPTGRDASLTLRILEESGLAARECNSVVALAREIEIGGAGAALVAEEAFEKEGISSLVAALDSLPPWSDFPVLVLTSDEAGVDRLRVLIAASANVTMLQRPIRMAMLLSAVQAALRSRQRQYETRNLLERLQQADRQKDEFLATMSHELRTPLNAIVGWTNLMQAEPCDAESHTRGLEVLVRNASAQTTIIEDLLDVSRIVTGKVRLDLRPVDVGRSVQAAVDGIRPTADARSISVEGPGQTDPIWVDGDPDRLQQIAWNLLSNAVKFTPAGGRIEVDVRVESSWAVIRIADTGRGIPKDFLPHLFERFSQADGSTTRRHGGLGLGLAIVRTLTELLGGSVHAESDGKDKGSRFEVRLPLLVGDPSRHPAKNAASAQVTPATSRGLEGVRVLVVDDNLDSIEMLRTVLGSLGAIVRMADSAEAGLSEICGWRPDVLISDIAMPGKDGFWLIETVRALGDENGGRTPAIALTAFADRENTTRTLHAGFQQHLLKPVSLTELAAAVAKLAGRASTAADRT